MDLSTTKEVIEDLIQINNDRINGYKNAIEEIEEFDAALVPVFTEMADHSATHVNDLAALGVSLNADIDQGTSVSGMLHRAWMDIKAAFTGGSKEAILESCEFGEDAILKVYSDGAKEFKELPNELLDLMSEQQSSLKKDHDIMKGLRDTAKAV